MNELELTEKAIAGSRDAFCDLYDLYRVRLYRYAYYRLRDRDDAEDAVSSCVLSAWEQIRKLKEPGAFPAWIFRILKGSCAAVIKAQIERKKLISLDPDGKAELSTDGEESREFEVQTAASGDTENEKAPDPETNAILMEALNTLDEESREMVLLSAVGGLTGRDIGEIYDMPQGTVRSRLSRSFAAMRKLMEAGNER
ncbi:MAG: sigma-70 family RNA polymerase sigma factor [Eubacterium sp.]|nr:sigma-70 family RNA polymerase sigma factor [Eubacterium sp.]